MHLISFSALESENSEKVDFVYQLEDLWPIKLLLDILI